LFADKSRIKIWKFHFWYLLFLITALISGFLGLHHGLDGRMIFIGWLLFAQFGLALISAQTVKSKTIFLKVILFSSLPLAAVGLYQFFTKVPTSAQWLSPGESLTRVFAFFGSPNVFGVIMAVAAIVSVAVYIKEKQLYWLFPVFLFLPALILTYSRSAWLGLFLAALYFLLIYNFKLVALLPLSLLLLFVPQIRSRLNIVFSTNYINDSSLDGRLWSFQNGLYIFKKHWLLGTGPGTYGGKTAVANASPVYLEGLQNGYTALYYTDNQFLEVLVQTGLFGIVFFVGFLLSVFSELTKKALQKDIMSLAAGAVVLVFVVTGIFGNVLEFGAVSLPTALIIGACVYEK